MENSVDPDEMACYEPSHLDQYCFNRLSVFLVCQAERVNLTTVPAILAFVAAISCSRLVLSFMLIFLWNWS